MIEKWMIGPDMAEVSQDEIVKRLKQANERWILAVLDEKPAVLTSALLANDTKAQANTVGYDNSYTKGTYFVPTQV